MAPAPVENPFERDESPVIRLRAFCNGDPPALVSLWNRGLPGRGSVRPLGPHEFDAQVIARIVFDREGLIVAEEEDGRVVGFAHASFGPESSAGPSHRLDRDLGTIAMLVVDPDRDDPGLILGLFEAAEAHLRRRGARVFYAGGQGELGSFYRGIYGGSECSGILDGHAAFRRAATLAGYEPVASSVFLEAPIGDGEARDPRGAFLRRQTRVEIVEDAMPADWWEAIALGHTEITRFRVVAKADDRELARASTWDMAAFGRVDGKARTGLIDLEVAESERRKGYGRFLVAEILRHAKSQWAEIVAVQTRTTNLAALGLYLSAGFEPVDSSTLYRRPGP